jgi:uncharacterized protein
MTLPMVLMFALAALLIGVSKGGLGGPVPVALTAPLLSLVIPVSDAVGIVLPLLLFADVFALILYWRKWDTRYIRLMLPMGVVGVVMGTLLLAALSNDVLRKVIGVFTLIAVLYKLGSGRLQSLQYQPREWHGYFAGWAAGFGSSLANVGAPPFTAYLLLQNDVTPTTFIGTTTLFFAIVNALKLPGFLSAGVLNMPLLVGILWVVPIIPFGVWLGRWTIKRMDAKFFERLMLALLFLMSIFLLL